MYFYVWFCKGKEELTVVRGFVVGGMVVGGASADSRLKRGFGS